MRERLKSLYLLCQIGKRSGHPRFKLLCGFGVSALPNLVLASGNRECLLGTKAALLDRGANLIPNSAEGYRKFREKSFLSTKHPFQERYHSGTTCCSKWRQAKRKKCKRLSRKNTTKWPQPFMFPIPVSSTDHPPAFHARCSYSC